MSEALAYETELPHNPHRGQRGGGFRNRDEILSEICELLEQGEPLAAICRLGGMPSFVTVYEWEKQDQATALAIVRAREAGEHAIAARLRRVANGDEGYSTKDVQRDKLIIETDLKLLAKWNPRKWGDSTQLRHADADGGKLDNSALVNELLALTNGQPVIESTALRVTPATPAAKPAFRPRVSHKPDDVSDLV